jgi:putative ABC transport system substrate-binding protein
MDNIFNCPKPGNPPVEQLTKFELVIDVKCAKALGLTRAPMLQSLLRRADEAFE